MNENGWLKFARTKLETAASLRPPKIPKWLQFMVLMVLWDPPPRAASWRMTDLPRGLFLTGGSPWCNIISNLWFSRSSSVSSRSTRLSGSNPHLHRCPSHRCLLLDHARRNIAYLGSSKREEMTMSSLYPRQTRHRRHSSSTVQVLLASKRTT
ncbi:unnamed protein product, partial [Nesidiocoris tenuis]